MPITSVCGRLRQNDPCKFKTSQGYIVNSRSAFLKIGGWLPTSFSVQCLPDIEGPGFDLQNQKQNKSPSVKTSSAHSLERVVCFMASQQDTPQLGNLPVFMLGRQTPYPVTNAQEKG